MKIKITFLLLSTICLFNCKPENQANSPIQYENIIENSDSCLNTGYRFSSYGIKYDAGINYWLSAGKTISGKFRQSSPSTIWIVGVLRGNGTYLNFPVNPQDTLIKFSETDYNEEILNQFDKNGFKIWLQVESGNASLEELILLVLNRYKHHPCVIGFGVDVEWYKSVNEPNGDAISDKLAQNWLDLIHSVNPDYKLFLKHWLIEKMPPTKRDNIVFIDDSQMFNSMEQMVSEFEDWGKHFSPAKVGFQFGYQPDKKWWSAFNDPMSSISKNILDRIPNTQGLYWVDFTLFDVFPPEKKQ